MRVLVASSCLAALVIAPNPAAADEAAPPGDATALPIGEAAPPGDATALPIGEAAPSGAAPSPAPKAPPAPYSLPWQLRPVSPVSVLRWDSTYAGYEDARASGGSTMVSTLLFSYKITPSFSPLVRWGMVGDTPPGSQAGLGGIAFTNPLVGAAYGFKLDDLRLGLFLGVALPLGSGGGDTPDKSAANARTKGIWARAAMDNALFAVNDLTIIPGVDVAYVKGGVTVQAEATLLFLQRARGSDAQPEASKINLTSGLHAGYFLMPMLSIGADLRYQRWLNAPIGVEKAEDAPNPSYAQKLTASQRDQASFAVGPRMHFDLGGVWVRPGISYGRGLDLPMAGAPNYHVVQLDVPVVF